MSRSQFLAYIAVGIGCTELTFGGLGVLAFRRPVKVRFRKLATNRNTINPPVFVTYASQAVSTMEIARIIALALEETRFRIRHLLNQSGKQPGVLLSRASLSISKMMEMTKPAEKRVLLTYLDSICDQSSNLLNFSNNSSKSEVTTI